MVVRPFECVISIVCTSGSRAFDLLVMYTLYTIRQHLFAVMQKFVSFVCRNNSKVSFQLLLMALTYIEVSCSQWIRRFFYFFFVVVWFLVFSSYSCQSSSFISLSIKSGETRKRYASKNPNKRVSQIIFFGAKLLADDETFMTNTAVSRHFNGNDTHTKSRLLLSLRCSLDSKWHARFVKICSFCCDSDVKCLFCLTFFKQTFLVEELQKMHATKHPSRQIQCKFKYFGSVWQMYSNSWNSSDDVLSIKLSFSS